MKPECTLIAYLHVKPERKADLLKILDGFVKPTRAEAGCVDYHLHVSADDPNLLVFYENWRTRADLDHHLSLPYLAAFWPTRMEYLARDVEMQFLTMLTDPQDK